jgi:hypothetical protein
LEERQENPKSALSLIANAIDLYKVDLEENPKSLNDLYVKQYLNLDAYPFDDPKWSHSNTLCLRCVLICVLICVFGDVF